MVDTAGMSTKLNKQYSMPILQHDSPLMTVSGPPSFPSPSIRRFLLMLNPAKPSPEDISDTYTPSRSPKSPGERERERKGVSELELLFTSSCFMDAFFPGGRVVGSAHASSAKEPAVSSLGQPFLSPTTKQPQTRISPLLG